jgi:hypothetical protein
MADPVQGVALRFGQAGNAAPYCAKGWSIPEHDETWAIGPSSRLLVPKPAGRGTCVLVLKLRPFVVAGKLISQRLRVSVNGVELRNFSISRDSVRVVILPQGIAHGEASLEIDFEAPDAARPSELAISPDRRQLSFAFRSVELYVDRFGGPGSGRLLNGDEPVSVPVSVIQAADQLPLHELMLKFESLGQNCEFGLVQRRCMAEPLGLLRFSSTPLPKLLDALEARFEGLGTPERTNVTISSNGREYMVNDTRFGFVYHAWVNAGEMSPEEVRQRELRRVPFLVRKLIEDLETAEKIFVFKGMSAMAEEEVFPLAAALRRYGPNTLLAMTLSSPGHRGGTVEARGPGFLVGYVDRFAPTEDANELMLEQWVRCCRDAYRLRLAAG